MTETFSGSACIVDELRMVGHWRFTRPTPNKLKPHMHKGTVEICYVAEGMAEWWVESRPYSVHRGQLFITKPSELHGADGSSPSPTELYWLQIAIPQSGPMMGLTQEETAHLEAILRRIESPIVVASFDPAPLFRRLLDNACRPSGFQAAAIRTSLNDLLLRIAADLQAQDDTRTAERNSPYVAAAACWINEHLAEEFSVEDVAAACGIASSYLYRKFSLEVGQSPSAYRQLRRIDRAKSLLRSASDSMTSIAMECGFASSQYFSTVFHNVTGMTPRQYRAYCSQSDPLSYVADYVD